MTVTKKIRTALISVYHKDNLEPVIKQLHRLGIQLITTGGTQQFIEKLGIPVVTVDSITDYPHILGGRVKTLHPKIFGGILRRDDNESDQVEVKEYQIPAIDLVVVDLYPFEDTVSAGGNLDEVIEKIDIGGISLIRAAAKNYNDVLIIPSREQYPFLLELLETKEGSSSLDDRHLMATHAFKITSHYDTAIFNYFNREEKVQVFKQSVLNSRSLRYGENPHQRGVFYGKFDELFDQLNGKEISYNNLLDIDAAVSLITEFTEPTCAILKHNNACGIASRDSLLNAWNDALAGDPVSAFGGIIIVNRNLDKEEAEEMNKLFFEVLIAPSISTAAFEILKQKKNRIILLQKKVKLPARQFRSLLNGVVEQDRDSRTETPSDMKTVSQVEPTPAQLSDMEFANKLVKHTKSNTIVLAKNKQLLASGTGQTSRVDALEQAIAKAKHFKFDLKGAVMSSDAFFPFPDCVEIAHNAGIAAVIHPGGSIKDQESIDFCNKNGMAMVITGTRHFKH
ncbi:MAG: bifunctional phosphoribosylaminoimidazolecarboxamide formyltransferase/IMP cyclohydrolase [Bacteroidota bacterium]